jgi:hypothetical protein
VKGNGKDDRFVINLMGQYSPGKVTKNETAEMREKWFTDCLNEILKIHDLESIGFPYNIGCGLAGGDWKNYYEMIEQFAEKTKAVVTIYQIN